MITVKCLVNIVNNQSSPNFSYIADLTPSRGNTPVHPRFSTRAPSLNKTLSDERPLGLNSDHSATGKKKSLFELFRNSIRSQHAVIDEQNVWSKQNGVVKNEDFKTRGRPKKYAQCCIPSFIERKKR